MKKQTIINMTPHAVTVHFEKCANCGDTRIHGTDLGYWDEGHAGGMGACGDMHQWVEEVRKFAPSGQTIRLEMETEPRRPIDGIPTSVIKFGEPIGLPEQADGVYYIVSQIVKSACPERTDLLVPTDVMRDTNGNIVGCRALGR
ncbi:MAG: hypothetical protein M0R06_01135 [Sphaerochaeta sp.]|jgi:hypothetical protein|nr:hypothetical protein [Sphaerochaeta sp.]